MKKLLAAIFILFSLILLARAIGEFREADNWLEVFKALAWGFLGYFTGRVSVADLRDNCWPWELRKDEDE